MDNSRSTTISISTHNVNGYKWSKEFLFSQCEKRPNSIFAIQEHWLRPPYKKQFGVNQLRCLHPNFDGYGTSAMSKSTETKISSGRPFGGTGFIFNKSFAKCVKPLINYSHERVTVLELNTYSENIVILNCYFPYFNSKDLENSTLLYRDTVGFIDNVMHLNRDSKFIILADFNCNIYDSNHRYTQLIQPLMNKYNLVSALDIDESFDADSAFTRFDVKTNSYTLIDGILISEDLRSKVSRVGIFQDGDNVSDHLPVEMDITLHITEVDTKKPRLPLYVNWKKLTAEQKTFFKDKMVECLSKVNVPPDIYHGNKCCNENTHNFLLEQYYLDIVAAVSRAELILPKTNPNAQRSFWNPELDELKEASIECDIHWKSIGRPKMGPAFECWKKCRFSYKSAIRRAKAENDKAMNEALLNDLANKDGVAFWKKWNSINKAGNLISSRINGETDEKGIAEKSAFPFRISDNPAFVSLKERFTDDFANYYSQHIDDNIHPFFVTWSDMLDVAAKIKAGKSSAGMLKPEHFLLGAPELMRHLQNLFNGMIQHSYVPTEFLHGSISPIVKDSQGDVSSTSNYRGITLLPSR